MRSIDPARPSVGTMANSGSYRLSGHSIDEVVAEAEKAWALLRDPTSDTHQKAKAQGIDVDGLPPRLEDNIELRKSGAAFGIQEAYDLLVAGASSAAAGRIGWDVWKYVILPALWHKFGDKVITEKVVRAEFRSPRRRSRLPRNPAAPAAARRGRRPRRSRHRCILSASSGRGCRTLRIA